MIYKETVKSMNVGSGGLVILATVIVVSLTAIVGLCNFIYNRFGIPYMSYIAFLLYILIGIYIYRRKLREYRYCITDDELIFEQVVGNRIKPIVNVKLSHIEYFCPLGQEKEKNIKYDRNYSLLPRRSSPSAYVLLASQGEKTIRIMFEPSGRLTEFIEKEV